MEQRLHLPGAHHRKLFGSKAAWRTHQHHDAVFKSGIGMSISLSPESHQAGRVADGRALVAHLQVGVTIHHQKPRKQSRPQSLVTCCGVQAGGLRGILRSAPCAPPAAARPRRPAPAGGSGRRPRPSTRRRASRPAASTGLRSTAEMWFRRDLDRQRYTVARALQGQAGWRANAAWRLQQSNARRHAPR